MIESALVYLLSNAKPGGALGAIIGDRVFPDELPKGIGVVAGADPDYPAATYTIVDGQRDYSHDGDTGLTPYRVQVDLYARTSAQVNEMRRALVADLSGFRGLVPVSPSVQVFGAFAETENDSVERDLEQSGPRIKRKSLDFRVWARG